MSFNAASLGLNIIGSIVGGIEQSKQLRASAAIDQENGRRQILTGEQNVLQTQREERQVSGEALANQSSDGIAVGSGSAGDILAQNAIEREMQIGNVRRQAAQEANNYYLTAAQKRTSANGAIFKGFTGALGSFLQNRAQMQNRVSIATAQANNQAALLDQKVGTAAPSSGGYGVGGGMGFGVGGNYRLRY